MNNEHKLVSVESIIIHYSLRFIIHYSFMYK